MSARDTHPRPQLTREGWLDLCGEWGFAFDDADRGLSEGWPSGSDGFDRTIVVPYPPESPASGVHDPSPHRLFWYRRTFVLPETRPNTQWIIHFGAVDYRASVWINGQLAITHEGGNTPFSANIAHLLQPQGEVNTVVVRAEDDPFDRAQPRGKQYWKPEPDVIWYHRTSGIWQPVWLEPVGVTHIESVRWTTDLVEGRIGLTVTLNHQPDRPLTLRVRLTLRDGLLADDAFLVTGQEITRHIGFEVPGVTIDRQQLFWSPEAPNLIEATLSLTDPEAPTPPLDTVESYLGIRSVAVGDGFFFLNGRPYYLRLALAQGYWPESHLAAPSGDAIRREVELAKSFGLNGLRLHQKVEDPRYLYWCDRLGLVVWGEMANAYTFSTRAIEQFTREWLDVVARDASHPCVVAWLPFNESWGVPNLEWSAAQRAYVSGIAHLTRALDPTRPVIGNDGWELFASDIWGVHDYALDPTVIRDRWGSPEAVARSLRSIRPYYQALTFPEQEHAGQPLMLTEIGGIDFVDDDAVVTPFPDRRASDQDDYLARLESLIDAVLACPTVLGFCYTQLTDTEIERSGFLTADRQPKMDPALIRDILTRPASAILSEPSPAVIPPPGPPA